MINTKNIRQVNDTLKCIHSAIFPTVDNGSDIGMVPSCIKPSPEPMLGKIKEHSHMGWNEFIINNIHDWWFDSQSHILTWHVNLKSEDKASL